VCLGQGSDVQQCPHCWPASSPLSWALDQCVPPTLILGSQKEPWQKTTQNMCVVSFRCHNIVGRRVGSSGGQLKGFLVACKQLPTQGGLPVTGWGAAPAASTSQHPCHGAWIRSHMNRQAGLSAITTFEGSITLATSPPTRVAFQEPWTSSSEEASKERTAGRLGIPRTSVSL
jgi:hypothetical protein